MNRPYSFCVAAMAISIAGLALAQSPSDWPQWRGPQGNGVVPAASLMPAFRPGQT